MAGMLERVNARVAKATGGGQPASRDFSLNVDEWSALFEFGGLTYPLIQTTMGNVKEERIVGSTIAAHHGNTAVFALVLNRVQAMTQVRFQWTRFQGSVPGDLFGTKELAILETPWPNGTTAHLTARMEIDNSIAGNSYIVNARPGRLARLRPDLVTIILGSQLDADFPMDAEDVEVAGYAYWPRSGKAKFFLPEQVAHYLTQPDPNFQFLGMSWLTPVIREVQADSLMTEHKARFFQNAATPNLAIKFDPSVNIDMVRKFKALMEEEHKGAFNAYKTLYMGGGADPVPIGMDFKQMDFALTQGIGEVRLCAAAGVPVSWAGFREGLQGSTLNAGNFTAARRKFSDTTCVQMWQGAAQALGSIVPPPDAGARLWYDARVPFMREDAADQADIQATEAQTITALVRDGFTPDSSIAAVRNHDWSLLKHSGLTSVQLLPPGAQNGAPANGSPPAVSPNGTSQADQRHIVTLTRSGGYAKSDSDVPQEHVESTTVHLLESGSHDLAHTRRHLAELRASTTDESREFNEEHLDRHIESAADHVGRLAVHLLRHYPKEAAELLRLEQAHPVSAEKEHGVPQKGSSPATVNGNGKAPAVTGGAG